MSELCSVHRLISLYFKSNRPQDWNYHNFSLIFIDSHDARYVNHKFIKDINDILQDCQQGCYDDASRIRVKAIEAHAKGISISQLASKSFIFRTIAYPSLNQASISSPEGLHVHCALTWGPPLLEHRVSCEGPCTECLIDEQFILLRGYMSIARQHELIATQRLRVCEGLTEASSLLHMSSLIDIGRTKIFEAQIKQKSRILANKHQFS